MTYGVISSSSNIFARYSRIKWYDTLFVWWSDEHWTPSEIAANNLWVEINKFCETLHNEHKKIYDWFWISYDNYSRTSSETHEKTVLEFFEKINKNWFITKETIEMFFDSEKEMFLPDRYVEWKCPKCWNDANWDQCEKCTAILSPEELVNPVSKLSWASPEIRATDHLFISLDDLSDDLKEWLLTKEKWMPHVKNSALWWIEEWLHKRWITRDLKYWIQLPVESMENKVFYVWFEAPIAYVSATLETNHPKKEEFWKKDSESEIFHFLWKDNIPFHTIFWPWILNATWDYKMPDSVIWMQYLNYEWQKFSKSKQIWIFCESLPWSWIDRDMLRAYLTLIIPDTWDSEFTWNDFESKINTEIIANFWNFINRSISLINKKMWSVDKPNENELEDIDKNLIENIKEKVLIIEKDLDDLKLKQAFKNVLSLSALWNKYLQETEPWHLLKEDEKRAWHVLYMCAYLAKVLSVITSPFLPEKSQKIWEMLNMEWNVDEQWNWGKILDIDLWDSYTPEKPDPLFQKLTEDIISDLKEKILKTKALEDFFN